MTSLTILLGVICTPAIIENKSDEPWNDHDMVIYRKAKVRCAQKYLKSPCLRKFTKRAPKTYWAVCTGGKHEEVTISNVGK